MMVMASPRISQEKKAAIMGAAAAKNPAISGDAYFWATVWKVKPKTEQRRMSPARASQVEESVGAEGISKKKEETSPSAPMTPIWSRPTEMGSADLAKWLVSRIHRA